MYRFPGRGWIGRPRRPLPERVKWCVRSPTARGYVRSLTYGLLALSTLHAAVPKPGTASPSTGAPKKPDYAQHTSFAGLDGFSTQQQPMGAPAPGGMMGGPKMPPTMGAQPGMASGMAMQQAGMGMASMGAPPMGMPGMGMPGMGMPGMVLRPSACPTSKFLLFSH